MLPKIQYPIFSLNLPISNKTVRYRPMLVREEKMLLIAKEGKEINDIINNLIQVVNNCLIDSLDLENLPIVEFEYLFLNIRARSIGSTIELKYYDTYDRSIVHDVMVDIDDVSIKIPAGFNTKVMLNESLGVMFKLPSVEMIRSSPREEDVETLGIGFICKSIDYIFDQDQVYRAADYSAADLLDFIESLPPTHFKELESFFENLPSFKYETSFRNSRGEDVKVTLTRLVDFF